MRTLETIIDDASMHVASPTRREFPMINESLQWAATAVLLFLISGAFSQIQLLSAGAWNARRQRVDVGDRSTRSDREVVNPVLAPWAQVDSTLGPNHTVGKGVLVWEHARGSDAQGHQASGASRPSPRLESSSLGFF